MYTIGIDFGTESGRALLVRVSDGAEIATAVHNYADGVIDERLPGSDQPLPPDWALQNPDDYLAVLQKTIPAVLQRADVSPEQVIGIDFTACTMLPVLKDGTPLWRLKHELASDFVVPARSNMHITRRGHWQRKSLGLHTQRPGDQQKRGEVHRGLRNLMTYDHGDAQHRRRINRPDFEPIKALPVL